MSEKVPAFVFEGYFNWYRILDWCTLEISIIVVYQITFSFPRRNLVFDLHSRKVTSKPLEHPAENCVFV